jgi:catechol 2,3-dioxygenase-like lactoylglutathione lyase family enzyme
MQMQMQTQGALAANRDTVENSRIVKLIFYVRDLAISRAFYEDSLNLELLQSDEQSADYDTGQIILCLERKAVQDGAVPRRDRSADLTFLVEDLVGTRDALVSQGVQMTETLRYEIGATVDFFDPDGHWISLYEPSAGAMTWPSSEKLKAVIRASGGNPDAYGSSAGPAGPVESRLKGCAVVYLFTFIPDPDAAFHFYNGVLGLNYLECRPCRRGTTENARGVVKYDTGGLMLTTHYRDVPEQGDETVAHLQCVTPVFHVADVRAVAANLAQNGINSTPPTLGRDGLISTFGDSFGRNFQLLETAVGGRTPVQVKIENIVAAKL